MKVYLLWSDLDYDAVLISIHAAKDSAERAKIKWESEAAWPGGRKGKVVEWEIEPEQHICE